MGVATGKLRNHFVLWSGKEPVQDITELAIQGPEKLSTNQRLLNSVPASKDEYDPLVIIRIVNHFQRLGKDATLKELALYAANIGAIHVDHRVPEDIETADLFALVQLVPLLFPYDEAPDGRSGKIGLAHSRLFVYQGVPFEMLRRSSFDGGGSGNPFQRFVRGELAWISELGIILEQPLRPPDDPLAVADGLLSVLVEKNRIPKQLADDKDAYFTPYYRWQAWKMIKALIKGQPQDLKYTNELFSDTAKWLAFRDSVLKLGIRWNPQTESYEAKSASLSDK